MKDYHSEDYPLVHLGHYSGSFQILNKYVATAGLNSSSLNKLTNGTDVAPDLFKLSANCSFILTHDICNILILYCFL